MMYLKDGGKIRVGLQILLAIFILFTVISCGVVVEGPLSINEILDIDVRLPIYHLNSNASTSYKDLDITYYYFSDSSPELRLDTYFTIENSEGKKVRLARMSTFNLSGQLVDIDETKGEPPTSIIWSQEGGGACKVLPRAYRNDRITGDAFQSCLYWLDKDLNQYKLYTVWSEEEAVNFVNSLIQVKKPDNIIK